MPQDRKGFLKQDLKREMIKGKTDTSGYNKIRISIHWKTEWKDKPPTGRQFCHIPNGQMKGVQNLNDSYKLIRKRQVIQ